MMRVKAFFVLLLAALLLVSTAYAGPRTGAFSITPNIGYLWPDDDLNLDDDVLYGLNLGYFWTPHWATELALGYAPTEVDGTSVDTDIWLYKADVLYHFLPDHKLVPFLAAGVGGVTFDRDNTGSDTDPLVNWGGGIKYFFHENAALRLDGRHLISFDDTENSFALTAGFDYLLGGHQPQVVTGPPPKDTDGDGVYDYLDHCPGTPKGVTVDQNGCPLDTDGDGVPDYLDKCPDTPKGVKVDQNGCPPDTDGDGVPDYRDKCPDTYRGAVVDEAGCELKLTLYIRFDFNSDRIRPEHKADIAKAAAFINQYPDLKILVAGHTDSKGSNDYNLNLSQRRAEAVRQALIADHNIAPTKLVAIGFGEEKPVADNATDEGRQLNRRVEVVCCTILPEK